jgi:tetratricopeptide (TPR) repeat protein
MAQSAEEVLDQHWKNVDIYNVKAEWEHMDRELDHIWDICSRRGYPDAAHEQQRCRCAKGKVARRQGRYEDAEACLLEALSLRVDKDIQQIDVLGELSTVYMQQQLFLKAKMFLQQQHDLAREIACSTTSRQSALSTELQMCRAIGNLGMTNYQLAIAGEQIDKTLLHEAIEQLKCRVTSAEDLQRQLIGCDHYETVLTWKALGLDRLTLCHAANGDLNEAIRCGENSRSLTSHSHDPTVKGLSRFFYGYALWRDGQREAAVQQWEFSEEGDLCTSVMALCKEPSKEQHVYLRIMVQEHVRMNGYDGQGYSALDYAVFSGDAETRDLILQGLASTNTGPEIRELLKEARLRREYRSIFQGSFRRELMRERSDCIAIMRSQYAKMLDTDETKRELLDTFKYVRYMDYMSLGRLPRSDDGITVNFPRPTTHRNDSTYVISISHRWLGKERLPSSLSPDNEYHTQYNRIKSAVSDFLDTHPEATPENIGLWLVSVISMV